MNTIDAADDYWTCNQWFVAGVPVSYSYVASPAGRLWGDFFGRRCCRVLNPVSAARCRRCGLGEPGE